MAHPVSQPQTPYVVASPRASDAIGCALRDAFDDGPPPVDMLVLLGQLNGNGGMRSRA